MSAVAAFEGPVSGERLPAVGAGAGAGWRLRGRMTAPSAAQGELLLNGARDFALPARLESPTLWHEATSGGGVRWLLRTSGAHVPGEALAGEPPQEWELPLRSVQLHLAAADDLLALMTPPPAPLRMRALAWLLLNLARIPGVAGLLARRRA